MSPGAPCVVVVGGGVGGLTTAIALRSVGIEDGLVLTEPDDDEVV